MSPIVKGAILLGGLGIGGYIVYSIYRSAKSQDAGAIAAAQKQVTEQVASISTAKPKARKVVRVV